jgi:hypothetical protein
MADSLEVFPGIHVGDDGEKWMIILSVAAEGPGQHIAPTNHHGIRHFGNGLNANFEGKPQAVAAPLPSGAATAMIYVPVEGQNAPAEVKVHPEIAERWKRVYRKHYGSLTPSERNEYGMLATMIGAQIGKTVFCPKG